MARRLASRLLAASASGEDAGVKTASGETDGGKDAGSDDARSEDAGGEDACAEDAGAEGAGAEDAGDEVVTSRREARDREVRAGPPPFFRYPSPEFRRKRAQKGHSLAELSYVNFSRMPGCVTWNCQSTSDREAVGVASLCIEQLSISGEKLCTKGVKFTHPPQPLYHHL